MAQSRRSLVCHSCCSFVTLAAGRRCCLAPLPAPPSLSAGVGIACWPSVFLVALLSHWLLAGVAVWSLSPHPPPFLLVLALLVGLLSFLLLFCHIGCWPALLSGPSPRAPLPFCWCWHCLLAFCHSCCSFAPLAAGWRCCVVPLPAPLSSFWRLFHCVLLSILVGQFLGGVGCFLMVAWVGALGCLTLVGFTG